MTATPWITDAMAAAQASGADHREQMVAHLRLAHGLERAAGELARLAAVLEALLAEIRRAAAD